MGYAYDENKLQNLWKNHLPLFSCTSQSATGTMVPSWDPSQPFVNKPVLLWYMSHDSIS